MPNSCQESHYLTSQILQYHLLWLTRIHSTTATETGCLPVTRPHALIMDRNGEREQPNISSYSEYILPLGRSGYHPLSASCSPPALPRWANAFPSLGTQAGILYVWPQADIQQVECQFLSFLTKPATAGTIIECPTAELQNLLQKKVVFSRADKCDYWSERSAHIKKGITSNFLLFRNLLFSSATLTSERKEREWKNKMLSRKRKNTEEMDWALEASVLTCNMEKRN